MASSGVWVRGLVTAALIGATVTAVAVWPASSAMAQRQQTELRRTTFAPPQMPSPPSLRETGRVADSDVTDPGTVIERRRDFVTPGENTVVRVAAVPGEERAPSLTTSVVADPVRLEREVRTHFATLPDCVVEVARIQQVGPRHVVASELLLRWTILPTGGVGTTAVVATAPIDPGVMSCVKQRMTQWTFSPLAGASAEVERLLVFPR